MLKYSYFPHQFLRNSGCFFVNVSRQPKVFFLQCRNFFKKLYAGIKEKKFLKHRQNLHGAFYTKCLVVQSDKFFHLRHVKTKYSRKAIKGRLIRSSKGLTWEDQKKFPSKHSRILGVRWYRLYFWAPSQLLKPSQSIQLFLGFQADYRICMLSQALSRPILQNDLTKTSFLLFPLL